MSYALKIKILLFGAVSLVFAVILISWGLDDIHGLLTHPARTGLLLLLLTQFLIIILYVPLAWMRSRLPAEPIDEHNRLVVFIGIMGILLFLMVSPFSDRRQWMLLSDGEGLRYFGLFLVTLGIFFSTWAAIHLCKHLTIQVQSNEQKLVTDGPFNLVRHPRDFGSILIFIGIPLVFLSSLGLLLAFLTTAGLFERISREEKMLQQQFQEEWSAYAQKTKCLIPWA
jgi:protein-S-isoprenylcysteine O-methyltransferase Ste14